MKVSDPGHHLDSHVGKTAGAHLLLSVDDDSHFFRPAWLAAQDATSRIYQILLPFGRPSRIHVTSAFFSLTDAGGAAIPKTGLVFPIMVREGVTAPTVAINITGIIK